ncbi:MAG: hypothetical protein ABI990_06865 [Actinomycetota bacterium]
MTRAWHSAKILAAFELTAAVVSGVALILLLAGTPPFECGTDYASPTTPLRSGGWAVTCFVAAVIGLLVAIGMALAAPRGSDGRIWARRAIGAALVATLVAGGAVFADLARWTCWP